MQTNIIHCGECAETMRLHLPDDSIDLTITSPPYDNLRDYHGYTFDFEPISKELWRVTKPGGVIVWVVADATVNRSETGTSFRQALGFMELGFRLHDTMIWEKESFNTPESNRYMNVFDYMFILSKSSPNSVSLVKDRVTKWNGTTIHGTVRNKDGSTKSVAGLGKKIAKLGYRFNVWKINSSRASVDHPAPFPEALARDHIISWSNPGDVILDPMCGSGTVPKMAIEQGRQYIGIDISEEYCKLSRQRIATARIPLSGLAEPKQAEAEQLSMRKG